MTILGRTNEHQQKIAVDAVKEQNRLAAIQLEEQRRMSNEQLAEQRSEAARVREQAAIAEVIIATEHFARVALQTMDDLRSHLTTFHAAVARWRVELGRGPMEDELADWGVVLFQASSARLLERLKQGDDVGYDSVPFRNMTDAISSLSTVALTWLAADQRERTQLKRKLTEWRLENEKRVKDWADMPSSM